MNLTATRVFWLRTASVLVPLACLYAVPPLAIRLGAIEAGWYWPVLVSAAAAYTAFFFGSRVWFDARDKEINDRKCKQWEEEFDRCHLSDN